ncbi:hypothetical protein LNI88_09420 [Tenacibaculum dicentrarchi]|nr:hypothetical protein [Tenacibaculum dicentrarchi]MCD8442819.1 hypothetical protein [Tenacibaculum dicentrarchi]
MNKDKSMMRIYLDKSSDFKMNPKKETIQFLINFSKSLKVIKTKSNYLIELNLN